MDKCSKTRAISGTRLAGTARAHAYTYGMYYGHDKGTSTALADQNTNTHGPVHYHEAYNSSSEWSPSSKQN